MESSTERRGVTRQVDGDESAGGPLVGSGVTRAHGPEAPIDPSIVALRRTRPVPEEPSSDVGGVQADHSPSDLGHWGDWLESGGLGVPLPVEQALTPELRQAARASAPTT